METSQVLFWTFITGVISALATGLGAIPVGYLHNGSKIMRAFSGAVAAGMMISASVFSLAQEGIALKVERPSAPYEVILGLLLGAGFFTLIDKFYGDHDYEIAGIGKGATRKGFLLFMAMFFHSIPEGIAIGVGFGTGDFDFGMIMALAISVHNIPEGIAISLPLRAEGVSVWKCMLFSIASSLPQPIMAVPAAIAVWLFKPLLAIGLGFAGGAMIYLVVLELIPEALEEGGKDLTAWGVMIGLSLMLLITTLLNMLHF